MRSEAVPGRTPAGEDFGKGSQCARRRQNLAIAGKLPDLWHVDRQPLVRLRFLTAAVRLALAVRMVYPVHFWERGPE